MPSNSIPAFEHLYRDRHITHHNGVGDVLDALLWRSGSYSRSWDRTVGFRDLKSAKVKIPTQNYTLVLNRSHVPFGTMKYYPTGSPLSWTNVDGVQGEDYVDWSVPNLTHRDAWESTSDIEQLLDTNLLSKIKDSVINIAQAFGERKQTASLLASSATRIAKAFTLLRRGNISGCINQLGAGAPPSRILKRFQKNRALDPLSRASSTWLELTYGWKPLLSDVYGAAQAIAKSQNRPHYVTVRSQRIVYDQAISSRRIGHGDALLINTTDDILYVIKKSISFEVSNTAAKTLSEAGISNPVNLGWELLPYSFVVDWFLPIGNYLGNIDATAGCAFVSGTRSARIENKKLEQASGTQHSGIDGAWTYVGYSQGSRTELIVTRRKLLAFPGNPLPQLKNPLSLSHVTSAFSLLQLAFKR